jgi:hypothetical protein
MTEEEQKPYLLIAGYNYYPAPYTDDWVGCYSTEEEAEEKWEQLKQEEYPFEWHDVVDLREWMYD